MILFFSDLHFGIRSYSQQLENGIFTAELEARKALEEIYEASCNPEISFIIFGGDFFHTNQPTSENIKFTIAWFKKMDALGKPFIIIPGNHDASLYSSGLAFLNSLVLINTTFVHESIFNTKWNNWNLVFIPYVYSNSMKDKDSKVDEDIVAEIDKAPSNTIIVAHLQESTAKIGSESIMLSKGVNILDIDASYTTKNIILLLGHIHKHQIYKKGYTTICYPGNTFYHDMADRDEGKGYCVVDIDGSITFKDLSTIRKFISMKVFNDDVAIFNSRRITGNQVVFVYKQGERSHEYEEIVTKLLAEKNCILGKMIYFKDEDELAAIDITSPIYDPYVMLETYLKDLEQPLDKEKALAWGKEYLQKGEETS